MPTVDLAIVAEALRTHDDFIVCGHYQPDGDTLGSTGAMGMILRALGKRVQTLTPGPLSDPFLEALARIGEVEVGTPNPSPAQWVVCCDCGNASRLVPPGQPLFNTAQLINIDHHHDNTLFGTLNLIPPGTSSTAEIIFALGQTLGVPLTKPMAECIYGGLLTDTYGFSLPTTTPAAHRAAAALLAAGVDPAAMHALVHEQLTRGALRLHGLAMADLREAAGGRIIWTVVTRAMLQRTGTVSEQTDVILSRLREVAGVELYCLIRETSGGFVKVSFRSKTARDVSAIARRFGGGGHIHAAGCVLEMPLAEAEKLVISTLEAELMSPCGVG